MYCLPSPGENLVIWQGVPTGHNFLATRHFRIYAFIFIDFPVLNLIPVHCQQNFRQQFEIDEKSYEI
jgi:hypothetical protein